MKPNQEHALRKRKRTAHGLLRWARRAPILGIDAALIMAAYVGAYLIRFEARIPVEDWEVMWLTLPIMVAAMAASFQWFGLYRRVWRHAGIADLTRVVTALSAGTAAASALIFLSGLRGHSRLVFLSFYALSVVLVVGFRVGLRNLARLSYGVRARGVPCLIVGSGDTGEMVVREIRKNPALLYRPVAIVSDSGEDVGLTIHDVPVAGDIDDLPALIADLGIGEVVVADPDLGGSEYKRIVGLCAPAGVAVRIFPSAVDLLEGKVEVSRIRSVQLEDLLRRKPVPPDLGLMGAYIGGKRVMITGAGGSIGSELCRQCARANPAALMMVDRVENSLYEIDTDIGERFPDLNRTVRLADITSAGRMRELLHTFGPDIVFHAAAFKHVPLMEAHPCEVILNNVSGTVRLAQLAVDAGVKDFVLISSDKAVNPANVMGASKRLTELCMQHLSNGSGHGRTKFLAVRFGNVLGSAGSLIPRLKRQIEQGGPVTITHPQMTRYFMTIGEAVQLVIEAASMSEGGEIFVLDMGEPVNVVDLAKDLVVLSGLEPGRDIQIVFTGLRPGEKLDEELWNPGEVLQPTKNPKITAIRAFGPTNGARFEALLEDLDALAAGGRAQPILWVLQKLIPEFKPQLVEPRGDGASPPAQASVLVVDDDGEMRSLMAGALRRAGLTVTTASDGLSALDTIAAGPPDVLVLDINMPGLDGISLFERLKQEPATKDLPVILVTGFSELGESVKALEFDAEEVISKPFRLVELVARVDGILRRRHGQEAHTVPHVESQAAALLN